MNFQNTSLPRSTLGRTGFSGAKYLVAFSILAGMTLGPVVLPQTSPATPKQILDKYVASIGGREAYLKLKTQYFRGEMHLEAEGVKISIKAYSKAPNSMLVVMTLPDGTVIREGCKADSAWSEDPENGLRELEGVEREKSLRECDFYEDIQLEQRFSDLKVIGKERVGRREAYILEGYAAAGLKERMYFDVESGLMLRRDGWEPGEQGLEENFMLLEDYRAVDGVKFPHRVRYTSLGGVATILEIRHNLEIPDSRFEKPKPAK